MSALERISAPKGSFLLTGTTEKEKEFNCFVANEDCEIAELYDSDDLSDNIVTRHITAGATLKAGQVIFNLAYKTFGKIKLTSGSVILH